MIRVDGVVAIEALLDCAHTAQILHVIVLGADGTVAGAVGISGDTSDNDEICALAGIAAAGLTAQG